MSKASEVPAWAKNVNVDECFSVIPDREVVRVKKFVGMSTIDAYAIDRTMHAIQREINKSYPHVDQPSTRPGGGIHIRAARKEGRGGNGWPDGPGPGPPLPLRARLVKEFRLLVCTSHPKYRSLRTKLNKHGRDSGIIIIAIISSAMGSWLGVAAGALGGLVAVLLLALATLGKEAFCSTVAGGMKA